MRIVTWNTGCAYGGTYKKATPAPGSNWRRGLRMSRYCRR